MHRTSTLYFMYRRPPEGHLYVEEFQRTLYLQKTSGSLLFIEDHQKVYVEKTSKKSFMYKRRPPEGLLLHQNCRRSSMYRRPPEGLQYRQDNRRVFYLFPGVFYPQNTSRGSSICRSLLCIEDLKRVFYAQKTSRVFSILRRPPEGLLSKKDLQRVLYIVYTFRGSCIYKRPAEGYIYKTLPEGFLIK